MIHEAFRERRVRSGRENRNMSAKNYAEVLIDGKIYTLGGSEEEHYLQRVASYINEKTSLLRKQAGFSKQSQDYQAVMVELNIADDFFKAREEAARAKKQRDDMEKETYSLKHELVTMQMRLDAALRELEEKKESPKKLEEELKALKEENQKLRAVQAAAAHVANSGHNNQHQNGKR